MMTPSVKTNYNLRSLMPLKPSISLRRIFNINNIANNEPGLTLSDTTKCVNSGARSIGLDGPACHLNSPKKNSESEKLV